MNGVETVALRLRDFMSRPEGWGRAEGREVYNKLLDFVESKPGAVVFHVSVGGVTRVDVSFASETIIEIARRYRGTKGFAFIDLDDPDMIENWDSAAAKKGQPMMLWRGSTPTVLGVSPTQGTADALQFALQRQRTRAGEFAEAFPNISIANASTKFKNLWEQGFLLRRENVAESGGVEYVYFKIGSPESENDTSDRLSG